VEAPVELELPLLVVPVLPVPLVPDELAAVDVPEELAADPLDVPLVPPEVELPVVEPPASGGNSVPMPRKPSHPTTVIRPRSKAVNGVQDCSRIECPARPD
jgi:hypothetical protein